MNWFAASVVIGYDKSCFFLMGYLGTTYSNYKNIIQLDDEIISAA